MRRAFRAGGLLMMVAGILTVGWAVLVWQWQDPFTAAYTKWQQHKLASKYASEVESYQQAPPDPRLEPQTQPLTSSPAEALAAERRRLALIAARYRASLPEGAPLGKIVAPRLGLNMIVVNGTAHDDLIKGPGRDLHTYMPGENELVYIAGHRTTYLAPFAHIDALRPGDPITLELPYGTFRYEVTGHRIVRADQVEVLRSHHHEQLILQACHPRFFATHRYLAYAKLVHVTPAVGRPYSPAGTNLAVLGRHSTA
jgi:sortase A